MRGKIRVINTKKTGLYNNYLPHSVIQYVHKKLVFELKMKAGLTSGFLFLMLQVLFLLAPAPTGITLCKLLPKSSIPLSYVIKY